MGRILLRFGRYNRRFASVDVGCSDRKVASMAAALFSNFLECRVATAGCKAVVRISGPENLSQFLKIVPASKHARRVKKTQGWLADRQAREIRGCR